MMSLHNFVVLRNHTHMHTGSTLNASTVVAFIHPAINHFDDSYLQIKVITAQASAHTLSQAYICDYICHISRM